MVYKPFVGLTEIKDVLGIASTNTDYDSLLNRWREEVSDYLRTRTGLDFNLNTYNEKIDIEHDNLDSIVVSQFPVNSVVALTNDGVIIDSDDYYIKRDMVRAFNQQWNPGIVSLKWDSDPIHFTRGPQKVEICYTAGFSPIPDDIKNAVTMEISTMFEMRNKLGIDSERIGGYSYTRAKNQGKPYSQEFIDIITLYKKRNI